MFLESKNLYKFLCFLFLIFSFLCCNSDKDYQRIEEGKDLVVILGSSSAYGIGASTLSKSWAALLSNEQTATIKNLSYPGYSTYEFLPSNISNFRNITPDKERNIDVAIKLTPKIIIFSITTNDIGRGYSIDEYLNNIKVMTDLCIDNNIEYIVTSTHPRNPMPIEKRKALYDLNRELERMYTDRYVEIYNLLGDLNVYKWDKNLCASDSIHGNDNAHAIIYNEVLSGYHKARARLSQGEK